MSVWWGVFDLTMVPVRLGFSQAGKGCATRQLKDGFVHRRGKVGWEKGGKVKVKNLIKS